MNDTAAVCVMLFEQCHTSLLLRLILHISCQCATGCNVQAPYMVLMLAMHLVRYMIQLIQGLHDIVNHSARHTMFMLQAGGGFVLFSMAVGLLLPLLLAAAAFVTITWVWAAATTLALASTPIMSQCGLALWFVGQAYFLVGGGDPIKCEHKRQEGQGWCRHSGLHALQLCLCSRYPKAHACIHAPACLPCFFAGPLRSFQQFACTGFATCPVIESMLRCLVCCLQLLCWLRWLGTGS